jgi:hypothetical protein
MLRALKATDLRVWASEPCFNGGFVEKKPAWTLTSGVDFHIQNERLVIRTPAFALANSHTFDLWREQRLIDPNWR